MVWYVNLGIGLVSGILRFVTGWAKSTDTFNIEKLLKTFVLSAVLGMIAGIFINDAYMIFTTAFVGDVAIEEIVKAGYKKLNITE